MAENIEEEDKTILEMTLASESIDELICQPCSEDGNSFPVHGFCVDCKDYLCKDCFKSHTKPRPLKNHVLMDKEQLLKDKPAPATKDTCTNKCFMHKTEIIKFYCEHHDDVGCSVCMTIHHRNCEGVQFIPNVIDNQNVKIELVALMENFGAVTKQFENITTVSKANIDKAVENWSKAIDALKTFKQDINETIDRLEDNIKKAADALKTEDTKRMDFILTNCAGSMEEIKTMKRDIECSERSKQRCRLFVAIKQYKKKLDNIHECLYQFEQDNTIKMYSFRRNIEMQETVKRFTEIGELSNQNDIVEGAIVKTIVAEGEDVIANTAEAKGEEKITDKPEYADDIRLTYVNSINVKSADDTELVCHIEDSVVLTGNRLLVADNSNFKIKLVDVTRNKIISELKMSSMIISLTLINENQIAATIKEKDGHKHLLILNAGRILAVDRNLEMSNPIEGKLSFHNNEFHWYSSSRVVQCNERGERVKVRITNRIISDMFGKCTSTSLGTCVTGDMLMHSQSHECIYSCPEHEPGPKPRYNANSSKITRYSLDGKATGCSISGSCQILSEQSGRVFVLDDRSVSLLPREGDTLKPLVNSSDGIYFPCSLSHCQDTGMVYIGQRSSNTLKVYRMS